MNITDILNTEVIAGGTTLGLVGASLKLLYGALREERVRAAGLGDRYTSEIADIKAAHHAEREVWIKEKEYLRSEISSLRSQVADLYAKLYKTPENS